MLSVPHTATARLVRQVLHYVTLGHRVQELHSALWHHLTQQQLDPCASYKTKLEQYSMYGHHGRGDEETDEHIVGGLAFFAGSISFSLSTNTHVHCPLGGLKA